jgi:hypothetical protein
MELTPDFEERIYRTHKPDDSPDNEQSSTHNHGIVHDHIHLSAYPDDPESTNPLIMELNRLKSDIKYPSHPTESSPTLFLWVLC